VRARYGRQRDVEPEHRDEDAAQDAAEIAHQRQERHDGDHCDEPRVDEEPVRRQAERPERVDLLGDGIVPSSAENAAPERPATMIAVMSGPSSRVDRQRHQVRDEDVGAELPELHDRLERRHHADEERDHRRRSARRRRRRAP
jgi:hypothetical protein